MWSFRCAGVLCGATALWAAVSAEGRADMIFNTYGDYGHAANDTGDGFCAATSFADSFRFLEKKNPGAYDSKLTGGKDTPTGTRDGIVKLQTLTTGADGVKAPASNQTVWESKVKYIQNNAPGTTVFAAEQDPSISTKGWLMAGAIQSVKPTLDFLFNELKHGEDVEIGFTGIGTRDPGSSEIITKDPFSHMVVLTGLDNVSKAMQYLDPNNPTKLLDGTFSQSGGSLFFDWNNGLQSSKGVRVFEAYSESAVPEPGPLTLFVLAGALGGAGYAQRRRVAAA